MMTTDPFKPVALDSQVVQALMAALRPPENTPALVFDLTDPSIYHDPRIANLYDSVQSDAWLTRCREMARIVPITGSDVVADLGAGSGIFTEELAKQAPRDLYAVEPADAMLHLLKERVQDPGVTVIRGSIDELAHAGLRQANLVYSSGVFVVLDDPNEFLEKVLDYLPPEGKYIFSVEDWRRASIGDKPYGEVMESVIKASNEYTGRNVDVRYNQATYTQQEVEEIIEQVGGRVTKHIHAEIISQGNHLIRIMQERGAPEPILKLYRQHLANKTVMSGDQHVFVVQK